MASEVQRALRKALRECPQVQYGSSEPGLMTFEGWRRIREMVGCGEPSPELQIAKIFTEAHLRTPEGRAEILAMARELRQGGNMGEGTEITTEGITREDVDKAMAFLGIFNPKPEIPLQVTVSGHEIVATARRIKSLEEGLTAMSDRLEAVERIASGRSRGEA